MSGGGDLLLAQANPYHAAGLASEPAFSLPAQLSPSSTLHTSHRPPQPQPHVPHPPSWRAFAEVPPPGSQPHSALSSRRLLSSQEYARAVALDFATSWFNFLLQSGEPRPVSEHNLAQHFTFTHHTLSDPQSRLDRSSFLRDVFAETFETEARRICSTSRALSEIAPPVDAPTDNGHAYQSCLIGSCGVVGEGRMFGRWTGGRERGGGVELWGGRDRGGAGPRGRRERVLRGTQAPPFLRSKPLLRILPPLRLPQEHETEHIQVQVVHNRRSASSDLNYCMC